MRKLITSVVAVLGATLSCVVCASDLAIQLTDPRFAVTIPGLPQVELGPHPARTQNPAARLIGSSSDGLNVSALVHKADGASAQQCASWLAGSTISRFAPELSSVQLVPAGENAWVLIFVLKLDSLELLKAYVFSGNNKGQCLEIHMSRHGNTEPQRQAWLSGFRGIAVKAD